MYGFKWINFIDTFVVCQALKSQAESRTAWDGSWVGGLRIGSEKMLFVRVVDRS